MKLLMPGLLLFITDLPAGVALFATPFSTAEPSRKDHLEVFATADAAEAWFEKNDPEELPKLQRVDGASALLFLAMAYFRSWHQYLLH